MPTKLALLALLASSSCLAAERATYDSAGGLTSLISNGVEVPVRGEMVVTFTGAPGASAQPDDQRSPVDRDGLSRSWHGEIPFPNGSRIEMAAGWNETDLGVAFDGSLASRALFPRASTMRFPMDVESVDYVIDLPRADFVGWHVEPTGQVLSGSKPEDPRFLDATTPGLTLADGKGASRLSIALDRPRRVTVTDVWDNEGRYYRVRIAMLQQGPWMMGDPLRLGFTLSFTASPAAPPASLGIEPSAPLFPFDGFGGNFRIYSPSPVVNYDLENLRLSWARLEFKALAWDRDRTEAAPGAPLVADFELMQRIQRMGVPWILSLWFLPERFYTDPNQKPFGTFARHIAPERWPEFLDLLGSYLAYLKAHYGAEPDLFSFNESDLGVNIGFSPDGHRDEIKRIGAYLAAQGFKTRMLLGDTANPRDSHKFVLPAAADPEAMRFVGAVSVHSWGGGTPEQYGAWGDVAAWLRLPLVVAEAGVDPGAYKNAAFDSYSYGIREARQFQELLRYARPQALIYWQFTDDYSLVHVGSGGAIEPTGRFWLMKQFVNLTPQKSEAVRSSSDQPDVLISAFARANELVVHVLNAGAERVARVQGLPPGSYRKVVTTEALGYQESHIVFAGGQVPESLQLPARSLTTLVRE